VPTLALYCAQALPRHICTLALYCAQADHDVDNLRLADIEDSLAVTEYELDALMLTGSCVDVTQGATRMVGAQRRVRALDVRVCMCVLLCVHACARAQACLGIHSGACVHLQTVCRDVCASSLESVWTSP